MLQAYVKRQPLGPSVYYPDSELFIFIDNGNSYCYNHSVEGVKVNVEALQSIMILLRHWEM